MVDVHISWRQAAMLMQTVALLRDIGSAAAMCPPLTYKLCHSAASSAFAGHPVLGGRRRLRCPQHQKAQTPRTERVTAPSPLHSAARAIAVPVGNGVYSMEGEFFLQLGSDCRVHVIREFLPAQDAERLLREVPGAAADRLEHVGSRQTAVFFEEPTRDYLFSGRRFKGDGVPMPEVIGHAMSAAKTATGEPFNGAVVNVYDTANSQIKWHDDGEYTVGPVVASYSLGRSATMGFRAKASKKKKSKWGKKTVERPAFIHGKRLQAEEPGAEAHGELRANAAREQYFASTPLRTCSAADVPVWEAVSDATGVMTLEVSHNTLVVMESGVQDAFEHRIFKPHLPPAASASEEERVRAGEGLTMERTEIEPRINLTFHVHW